MNAILDAAAELESFFQSQRWSFCLIGGLAVLRWGRPRATQDVDVSLYATLGSERQVIETVLSEFSPRIHDAAEFAIESRVVLAQSRSGIPLDIALAQFDFEKGIIDRATPYEFAPGVTLTTATANDLVVLKAFAGRDQDWSDVRGILESSGGQVELDVVFQQLQQLCEIQPENPARQKLKRIVDDLGSV